MNDYGSNDGLQNFPLIGFLNGTFINDLNENFSGRDNYHVYVNGDYIGDKVLVSESEDINDLKSYLKENNFSNCTTKLEGNHFNIYSEDSQRLKKNLNVYLKIR